MGAPDAPTGRRYESTATKCKVTTKFDNDMLEIDSGDSRAVRGRRVGGPVRRRPGASTVTAVSEPFWGPDFGQLQQTDPEIADVLLGELERLRGGLQLIASENLTSPAVLAALTTLTGAARAS